MRIPFSKRTANFAVEFVQMDLQSCTRRGFLLVESGDDESSCAYHCAEDCVCKCV